MNEKSRTKIKVFLVDDHPAVRAGVRSYLTDQGSVSVVGEAGDPTEALRKLKKVSPDVILMDIGLPGMNGGELTRLLRRALPSAKIIAFSMHSGREYVVWMARCGVHGYVTKDAPTARLVEAIHRVHKGGLYFPADMPDALQTPGSRPPSEETNKVALTKNEREALALFAEGLAEKEVARRLGISFRTAGTLRERLSRRIDIMITGPAKAAPKRARPRAP